jgi:hypothetical protein
MEYLLATKGIKNTNNLVPLFLAVMQHPGKSNRLPGDGGCKSLLVDSGYNARSRSTVFFTGISECPIALFPS